MASIRKRDCGKWQAIVRIKGYPNRSKSGFANKTQARRWAEREETAMRTGRWADSRRAEQVTLKELLQRYSKTISTRKRSCESEQLRIRNMCKRPLAKRIVATLRPEDINNYADDRLSEGLMGSSVNRELNLLHHLFVIARKKWGINIPNPCDDIDRPKDPPGRNRRLQDGEEQALLNAARAARNPWIEPMVVLAIETAMRRGELLAMRWVDVNFADRFVHLPETKNGYSRDVPLSPRALKILSDLPRSVGGHVFPITLNAWRCAWKRTRTRSGLVDFRFHDLRHEATSRFFERGDLNIMEVASITGHRDLRMLKRYTHPRASDISRKLAANQSSHNT